MPPRPPLSDASQNTEHHQSILRAVMDAGVEVIQNVQRSSVFTPIEMSLAYERAARAIRQTIMLAEKLAEPPRPARDPREPSVRDMDKTIHREIHAQPPAETLDRERAERPERLERPDLGPDDDDIDDRPIGEIIDELAQDMGLTHDDQITATRVDLQSLLTRLLNPQPADDPVPQATARTVETTLKPRTTGPPRRP